MFPIDLYERSRTSVLTHGATRDGPVPVVVGAPHHAPAGVRRLKCDRRSDQNTGLLAWRVAELARVPIVIVTNADADPNKSLDSEYSKAVASYGPRVLLEIHGHRSKKARFDVEVSAGCADRSEHLTNFVAAFTRGMTSDPELKDLSVSGDFERIHFKATDTVTMRSPIWLGLHAEFPLSVRKQRGHPSLPQMGERLATYIAAALIDLIAEAE